MYAPRPLSVELLVSGSGRGAVILSVSFAISRVSRDGNQITIRLTPRASTQGFEVIDSRRFVPNGNYRVSNSALVGVAAA